MKFQRRNQFLENMRHENGCRRKHLNISRADLNEASPRDPQIKIHAAFFRDFTPPKLGDVSPICIAFFMRNLKIENTKKKIEIRFGLNLILKLITSRMTYSINLMTILEIWFEKISRRNESKESMSKKGHHRNHLSTSNLCQR